MSTMLSLFSLLFLLTYAAADLKPFNCSSDIMYIAPSFDETLYFPDNSTVPLPYSSYESCIWTMGIPKGTYGYLTLNLDLCPGDQVFIWGSSGFNHNVGTYDADIPSKGTFSLYCPAMTCTLSFHSYATTTPPCNGTFSFSVRLHQLPDLPKVDISSDEEKKVVSLQSLKGKQSFYNRTDSDTLQFSLRTIANGCNWYDYRYDVCHVYEGTSATTGRFLTGLSYSAVGHPRSYEGPITIFCFDDELPAGGQLLLSPVPNIGKWQVGTNCSNLAANIEALGIYFTDYCPQECSKYVSAVKSNWGDQGVVKLYSDAFDLDNSRLEMFTYTNSSSVLPQRIDGMWKTILSIYGTVQLTADSSQWESPSPRRGFIASANYGVSSSDQNFNNSFKSSKRFKYSYNVQTIYSGQLQIVADLGSGNIFNHTIYPNATESVREANMIAYSMSISYDMGTNGPSNGAYLTYEIADGASFTGFIMIFAVLLAMFS